MKKSEFIQKLDHPSLEAAIAQAESRTSGEIRVVVTHGPSVDPVAAAREAFVRLGMTKTRERNSVLLFVAPASQTFAVIGDEAVHQKCGDTFWAELAATISGHFKQGKYNDGLLHGIARAGTLLAEHFPRRPDDADELPNQVIEQ